MSPLMKVSEKAALRSLRQKRNPGLILPSDFFDESNELRNEFAKLIHVPDPKRIAIIPSASYGLANVAANIALGKGDKIVVASEQFPSNYYPWQRIANEHAAQVELIAPPEELEGRGRKWNERILESIDSTTRVVALGNIHWTDGTLFHLREIRTRTRDVGALLIVDGTQSIGAMPFNVAELQPDAVVCSGYKWLLGPYSLGLAYYGEYFDNGKPIEESWMNRAGSDDFTKLGYQSEYQPGALRYDVGEHSYFILAPMLLTALRMLNRWHPENIEDYCRQITRSAVDRLREAGYWVEDDNYRSAHLFGLRFNHKDPKILRDLLVKNKIYVSFRGNALRISCHVFNNEHDMDRLVNVLTRR